MTPTEIRDLLTASDSYNWSQYFIDWKKYNRVYIVQRLIPNKNH
jgi:hypothetical protein